MKRERFVLSVICLTPLKVSNFQDLMKMQFYAINEFITKHPNLNINKDNSIFYGIFELRGGFRFTMDINMYKKAFMSKSESESKLNTILGQLIGVLPQRIFKPLTVIDPIRAKFKIGEDYAITRSYNSAWDMIEQFNGIYSDQNKIDL